MKDKLEKTLQGRNTIALKADVKIANEIYNRGYPLHKEDPKQVSLVADVVREVNANAHPDEPVVDLICEKLDQLGIEREKSYRFEDAFYRKGDVAELYKIAQISTKVKDPDKFVNFLRGLYQDTNGGLTLDNLDGYLDSYNEMYDQSKKMGR